MTLREFVDSSKPYLNKTAILFLHTVKEYGDQFLHMFNATGFQAVFLADRADIENGQWQLGNLYYITKNVEKFDQFKKAMKDHKDIVKIVTHHNIYEGKSIGILVVKVPERYFVDYMYLITGEYTKIFSSEDKKADRIKVAQKSDTVINLLNGAVNPRIRSLLVKHFINRVREVMGAKIDETDVYNMEQAAKQEGRDMQYDLPAVIQEEAFDYSSDKTLLIREPVVKEQVSNTKYKTLDLWPNST